MGWWKSRANYYSRRLGRKQSSGIKTEMGNTRTQIAVEEESMPQEDFPYIEINSVEIGTKSEPDELFYIITLSFLSLSFILAMIVDDLGIILALVGATGSTLVSYILPGLIYLKLHPDSPRLMAWVQLIAGLCVTPVSLYYLLTKQATH
jgi:hypothetical protein